MDAVDNDVLRDSLISDVSEDAGDRAMARAYSGVLGTLALCLVIVCGLVARLPPDEILSQGLVVFFVFGVIGFWIGNVAQKTVSESVENRFRSEMARLKATAANSDSGTSEQRDQVGMATGRGTR